MIRLYPSAVLQRDTFRVDNRRLGRDDPAVREQPIIGDESAIQQRRVDNRADHGRRVNEVTARLDQCDVRCVVERLREFGAYVAAADNGNFL